MLPDLVEFFQAVLDLNVRSLGIDVFAFEEKFDRVYKRSSWRLLWQIVAQAEFLHARHRLVGVLYDRRCVLSLKDRLWYQQYGVFVVVGRLNHFCLA